MRSKWIEDFIEKGLKEVSESNEKQKRHFSNISDEMSSFKKDLEERKQRKRIIRNKRQ